MEVDNACPKAEAGTTGELRTRPDVQKVDFTGP